MQDGANFSRNVLETLRALFSSCLPCAHRTGPEVNLPVPPSSPFRSPSQPPSLQMLALCLSFAEICLRGPSPPSRQSLQIPQAPSLAYPNLYSKAEACRPWGVSPAARRHVALSLWQVLSGEYAYLLHKVTSLPRAETSLPAGCSARCSGRRRSFSPLHSPR